MTGAPSDRGSTTLDGTQRGEETALRILLVEDNRQLSDWLAKSLERDHFIVDQAYAGDDADYLLNVERYALVVLDLGLPGLDGLEVLKRLRARGNTVPVLILTADDSVRSRVSGLDCGADDYLAKPFDLTELEARIRAQLRRSNALKSSELRCGTLLYDVTLRRFTLGDEELRLTAREHAILETLIVRAGATVSKDALTHSVFGYEDEANPNALEVHVHRVRKKLAGSDVSIVTLRGLGYVLKAESSPLSVAAL
jgi:two-component system, OmpR family, response regulator TctD